MYALAESAKTIAPEAVATLVAICVGLMVLSIVIVAHGARVAKRRELDSRRDGDRWRNLGFVLWGAQLVIVVTAYAYALALNLEMMFSVKIVVGLVELVTLGVICGPGNTNDEKSKAKARA